MKILPQKLTFFLLSFRHRIWFHVQGSGTVVGRWPMSCRGVVVDLCVIGGDGLASESVKSADCLELRQ